MRRRMNSLVLTALCAVALPLTGFSASAAHAQTASASGFGPTLCKNIGNGDLCATGISGSPAGYDAAYKKVGGSTVTVRFYLECKNGFTKADNGSFTISAGQRKSFVFSVGNQGSCRVQMYDIGNADPHYSPYVTIP